MGAGGELGEHHLQVAWIAAGAPAEEKFHPKQPRSSQMVGHGFGHGLGLGELLGSQGGRLPAALVVAALLDVANRRTKQGGPLPRLHGEQGDFQLEVEKFLHDHPVAFAAGTGHGRLPGPGDLLGPVHHALALAR